MLSAKCRKCRASSRFLKTQRAWTHLSWSTNGKVKRWALRTQQTPHCSWNCVSVPADFSLTYDFNCSGPLKCCFVHCVCAPMPNAKMDDRVPFITACLVYRACCLWRHQPWPSRHLTSSENSTAAHVFPQYSRLLSCLRWLLPCHLRASPCIHYLWDHLFKWKQHFNMEWLGSRLIQWTGLWGLREHHWNLCP